MIENTSIDSSYDNVTNLSLNETPTTSELSIEKPQQPLQEPISGYQQIIRDLTEDLKRNTAKLFDKEDEIADLKKKLMTSDKNLREMTRTVEMLKQQLQDKECIIQTNERIMKDYNSQTTKINNIMKEWAEEVKHKDEKIQNLQNLCEMYKEEIKLREEETLKLKRDSVQLHQITNGMDPLEIQELIQQINSKDPQIEYMPIQKLRTSLKLMHAKMKSMPKIQENLENENNQLKLENQILNTKIKSCEYENKALQQELKILNSEREGIKRVMDASLWMKSRKKLLSPKRRIKQREPSNEQSDEVVHHFEISKQIRRLHHSKYTLMIISNQIHLLQKEIQQFNKKVKKYSNANDLNELITLDNQRELMIKKVDSISLAFNEFIETMKELRDYAEAFETSNTKYKTPKRTKKSSSPNKSPVSTERKLFALTKGISVKYASMEDDDDKTTGFTYSPPRIEKFSMLSNHIRLHSPIGPQAFSIPGIHKKETKTSFALKQLHSYT